MASPPALTNTDTAGTLSSLLTFTIFSIWLRETLVCDRFCKNGEPNSIKNRLPEVYLAFFLIANRKFGMIY